MSVPEALALTVGTKGERAELAELQAVSECLVKALRALAREMSGRDQARLRLEIAAVHAGSLVLEIVPVFEGDIRVPGEELLATFTSDLEKIAHGDYRPSMTSTVLRRYRQLIKAPSRSTPLRLGYRDTVIAFDAESRDLVENSMKATTAPGVSVTGTIEAVNIHARPFTFTLYTKLEPRDRIECRFDEQLLPAVAGCLKDRGLVQVQGEGRFGPVGLHPLEVIVDRPPSRLEFDPETLASFARRYDIVPRGVRVEDYVAEMRERYGAEA